MSGSRSGGKHNQNFLKLWDFIIAPTFFAKNGFHAVRRVTAYHQHDTHPSVQWSNMHELADVRIDQATHRGRKGVADATIRHG